MFSRFDSDRSPRIVPGGRRPAVGGPVQRPDHRDRLVALEHQRHQRAGGDELAQRRVEVALEVLGVVPVGRARRRRCAGPWPRCAAPCARSAPSTSPTSPRRTASGLTRTRVRSLTGPEPSPGVPEGAGPPAMPGRPCGPGAARRNHRAAKTSPSRNIAGTRKPAAMTSTCSTEPARYAPGPAEQAGREHAGHRQRAAGPPERRVVDVAEGQGHEGGEEDDHALEDQDGRGDAPHRSPSPQQGPRLGDGHDRAGHQHARAAEVALLLGEGDGGVDGVVEPRGDLDPVLAEHLDGDRGQVVGRHRAAGGRLGDDDLGEHRLEGLEHPPDVLVGHRGEDTDQPGEAERVLHRLGGGPGARPGCGRRRAARSASAGPPRAGPAR